MDTLTRAGLAACALALWGCMTSAPATPPAPGYEPDKRLPLSDVRALASVANAVYAATPGGVAVIDADAVTIATTLKAPGFSPEGLAASHDLRRALAWDGAGRTLAVLAPLPTHTMASPQPVDGVPVAAAYTPDDQQASMALADRAVLLQWALDATPRPTASALPLGGPAGGERRMAADGAWVVIADRNGPSVTVVELATGQVRALAAGEQPGPVALAHPSAEKTLALVGHGGAAPGLMVYDLRGGEVTTIGGLGAAPGAIAVDDDLARAWVTLPDAGQVAAIDLTSRKLLATLGAGPRPGALAVVPSLVSGRFTPLHTGHAGEVWVGDEAGEAVSVLDAEWLVRKATLKVGPGPHRLAFLGTQAYVSTREAVTMTDRRRLPLATASATP